MKKGSKRLFVILAFLLLVLPLVSAVEFEMPSKFKQGETLIAKVSGQFTQTPLKQNIEFLRGHTRIAMNHEVAKIGESFYIVAPLTGKGPNNYSIVIEDVEYRHEGKTVDDPLIRNFTIEGEFADFSINKGFISANDDFSITVENLKDNSISIALEITTISGNEEGLRDYEDGEVYDIAVLPGQKTLDFKLGSEVRSSIKELTLKSANTNYTIPVSIFIDEVATEDKIYDFDIAPPKLEIKLPTGGNITKLVYIYNTGTGRLSDVEITLDESLKPYMQITEDKFGQILPENNANFELIVVAGKEQTLGGDIFVRTAEGVSDLIRVSLEIEEGYELPAEETQDLSTTENCEEIKGQVCTDEEECDGDYIFAKNQFCCIGKCVSPTASSFGGLIGWIIIIVIIVAAAWFFLTKYKKKPKPINLLQVASRRR